MIDAGVFGNRPPEETLETRMNRTRLTRVIKIWNCVQVLYFVILISAINGPKLNKESRNEILEGFPEIAKQYYILLVLYAIIFILAALEHFGKRMLTAEGTNLGTVFNLFCQFVLWWTAGEGIGVSIKGQFGDKIPDIAVEAPVGRLKAVYKMLLIFFWASVLGAIFISTVYTALYCGEAVIEE